MTATRRPDDARAAGTQTFVDVLEYRARHLGDRVIFREVVGDGEEVGEVTYAELRRRACACAAVLADLTVPGDRVVLFVAPGLDYVASFFGCLYAGVVAVPAYPPHLRRPDARVGRILTDCNARVALLGSDAAARLDRLREVVPELTAITCLDAARALRGEPDAWCAPDISGDSVAMLQYTSGSTSEPRGVVLEHRHLLANAAMIHTTTAHREGDSAVFWLPPFHDMGLLGGVLQPIYADVPTVVMAPTTFLQRPARWLEAISRYRATTSGAPNFAYDLCVQRVTEGERSALDLSAWRTAFNGAEPVRSETIARFLEAFAPAGLRRDVFVSCYGLAEATLLVAAERVAGAVPDPVGVGEAMDGLDVRVVDPDAGLEVPEGSVGELWVAGPSVARGYWTREDASSGTFGLRLPGRGEAYLRTGDLGRRDGTRLVITGRLKDLIILEGRNFYPHDLELVAERSHPALRAGFTCAFGVPGAAGEEFAYVAEVSRRHKASDDALVMRAIRGALAATFGIVPGAVVLVRAHSIPRTSSGKLRRGAVRRSYITGTLDVVGDWKARAGDVATPEATLVAFVVDWLATDLGVPVATLGPGTRLRECGLDSLSTTRLLVALEERVGRRLDIGALWVQSTVGEVVTYVLGVSAGATRTVPTLERAQSLDPSTWPEVRRLRERREALADACIVDPFFRQIDGLAGREVVIDGRAMLNFASYNYLGLAGHPEVRDAARAAIDRYGTSVSASRLVSGERPVHADLERAIARFLGVDDALVFTGGWSANASTIPMLVGPSDLVCCDAHLHNSAMVGALHSGASRLVFPHNDVVALDVMLTQRRAHHRRALIVIEGLYSADGDVPDLAALVAIGRRHDALVMVDEAHSLGALGATGRGIAEHAGVPRTDVAIWMGTLSKAFASAGGFIAGAAPMIEFLRYSAPAFVFSVGMTPPDAAAALTALDCLQREPGRVRRLQENGAELLTLARRAGLDTGLAFGGPILSVIAGSSARALRLTEFARQQGVHVAPMVEPAVAEGAARIRMFVSSEHQPDDLRRVVDVLVRGIREVDGVAADAGAVPVTHE